MQKNIYNSNKVQYEYYIPMGKAGPLVIHVPVVLASLKISIPLCTKININKNIKNINTIINKIFLTKIQLDSKNKLLVSGHVKKELLYHDILNKSHPFNIKIPFNEKIIIKFNQVPICTHDNVQYNYKKTPNPINFDIEYMKIINDSISKTKKNYLNTMVVSLKLTLSQVQNIFIEEPEGDALLLSQNSLPPILDKFYNKTFYYTIGFDPKTGLIASKNMI